MTSTLHTQTPFPSIDTPAGPVPHDSPAWNQQKHSQMPSHRYQNPFDRVEVPHSNTSHSATPHSTTPLGNTPHTARTWPSRQLAQAPLWVPVDLRDGNQALAEPMSPERKRRFFELMIAMGYKEIEVGYPSASQTDYDFVRLIADTDLAPADVTIVVFTPARRDLIERTVESIRGITNPVVIHMYTATAPTWRDTVLGKDRAALKELILAGGRDVYELAAHLPNVRFQFSPEVFNLTEPDYALDICNAITELWRATPERPVILNLPATVEIATPNMYADQIEYMHQHLARRDSVILSVHPHNDRGTGIACAELAVLAGAQRVEGCIFGNGERTGNVDIATLALNLHSQGIDPMIDFSDIDEIRRTVEYCNQIEVHPRHPYVGDLVHTAFSGTHQDAIKKGFAEHRERAAESGIAEHALQWRVPYLPIDPADLGRSYDAVIRVNSQSGKGGIAYLLETGYGVEIPRRLQIELAGRVQAHTDATGAEVSAAELWEIFERAYLTGGSSGSRADRVQLVSCETVESGSGSGSHSTVTLQIAGSVHTSTHGGVGPVEACTAALAAQGVHVEILSLHQTSVGSGNHSQALTLLEVRDQQGGARWVAGRAPSVLAASLEAVIRAANGSVTP